MLIGDGLGIAGTSAARAELVGPNGRLSFERMPVIGLLSTHSAVELVTDSAAAGTALATGRKTDNGMLAVEPSGRPLRTIAERLASRGFGLGFVTTSYLLDATPAAFLVHLRDRDDLTDIAQEMAASPAELLVGELPEGVGERGARALTAPFAEAGFGTFVSWEALVAAAPPAGERVVAMLAPGSLATRGRPTLATAAHWALERLAAAHPSFFLMVEQEETDTAGHRHDLRRFVRGVAELDRAVRVALDFARDDGATLVLVTSDHDTGGLSVLSGHDGGRMGIRWSSWHHTGEPVALYAYGPGAERFGGVHDNTELAPLLAATLGIGTTPASGKGSPAGAASGGGP